MNTPIDIPSSSGFVTTRRAKRPHSEDKDRKKATSSKIAAKHVISGSLASKKLTNVGNSCFMNAVFQGLAAVEGFVIRMGHGYSCFQEFEVEVKKMVPDGQKMVQFYRMVCEVLKHLTSTSQIPEHRNKVKSSDLKFIRRFLGSVNPDFDNLLQQDASEFLTILLQQTKMLMMSFATMIFEVDLSQNAPFSSYLDGLQRSNFANMCPGIEFQFQIEFQFKCTICKDLRKKLEDIQQELSLVPVDGQTLQQVFENSFGTHENDGLRCQKCGGTGALISSRVNRFPETFFIIMKRYTVEGGLAKKVEADVSIGKCLFTSRVAQFQLSDDPELKIETVRESLQSSLTMDQLRDEQNSTVLIDTPNQSSSLQILDEHIISTISYHQLSNFEEYRDLLKSVDLVVDDAKLMMHLRQFEKDPIEVATDESPKHIKLVRGDGNCFYRAISWLLSGDEGHYKQLRKKNVDFIDKNDTMFQKMTSQPIAELVKNAGKDCEWACELEIIAMSTILQADIFTFLSGKWVRYQPKILTGVQRTGSFYLNNRNGVHFEPVVNIFGRDVPHTVKGILSNAGGSNGGVVGRRSPRLLGGASEGENCEAKMEVDGRILENIEIEGRHHHINRQNNDNSPVYSLCSLVCHQGDAADRGHYTAYARNASNGEWVYSSDSVIYPVSEEKVMENGARNGYMLFYTKIRQ